MSTSPQSSDASALGPLVNLPGVRELREAVANRRRSVKEGEPKDEEEGEPKRSLSGDAMAGLTVAIASFPDGMAAALLAGVNPIHGLYASIAGPIAGGLLSSTRLMVVTSTSATAIVAGQSLSAVSGDPEGALFLTVVLGGLFAIAFGLAGFGRLTRFVSYSVMTGFLAGIAVILVMSQLPTVVGFEGEGSGRLSKTLDLLFRLDEVDLISLALSGAVIAILFIAAWTPLRKFASLFAIVLPTAAVVLLELDGVPRVRDLGEIGGGFPMPSLPDLGDSLDMITGALSLALIMLIQGAGVSQSVPNPDGSRRRASRDFIAQGAGNIASGLFRGLPVGGSLGATALNVASGARGRWAGIFAGLWMAAIVIFLPELVGHVAMPALAALLVYAGLKSIKPRDLRSVSRAGWPSRLAALVTFAATLVLPIQIAIALGVAISTMLYVNRASTDVSLVALVEREDGQIEEREPPASLPGGEVTVFDIHGHIFYAGARTLDRQLPRPARGDERPVVVLRMRGRKSLGATFEEVIAGYSAELSAAGGRLYLTGVSAPLRDEVMAMRKLQLSGPVQIYEMRPVLMESTRTAHEDAEAWLVG